MSTTVFPPTPYISTTTSTPSNESAPLYASVSINIFLLCLLCFVFRKEVKRFVVRRVQRFRRHEEEQERQDRPILRRPINHNDYFTLTSRSSLNDDTEPLVIHQPTATLHRANARSDDVPNESPFSAGSTTGSFKTYIMLLKLTLNKNEHILTGPIKHVIFE
jgi:hypothetical protein